MPTLRLFGPAREAAGVVQTEVYGDSVGEVLDAAEAIFGDLFGRVVRCSRIWRNGEAVERGDPVENGDELAVLPPVSGG
jgi:molybdopterin converting factor small subunit